MIDWLLVVLMNAVIFLIGYLLGEHTAHSYRDEQERKGMTHEEYLRLKIKEGDDARRKLRRP